MLPSQTSYDVVVVGGGPAGCAAAIAHAQGGARTLLLEAEPRAAERFAGEWLHPTGVEVLDELRVDRLRSAQPQNGYGFVIFPDDGSDPIEMPYSRGVALSCEHAEIVRAMRESASAEPGVEVVMHARAVGREGGRLSVEDRESGRALDVSAGRIVGADGRKSFVRKSLEMPEPPSAPLGYMAAIELRDVELPHEGFGHLVLGGPGPALFYRISDDVVRGCLDLPLALGPGARSTQFLWDAFAPVLPEGLRVAMRRALEDGPSGWAINRFRPRAGFGAGDVALVGDAVGHVHPMTANGITLGLLDARELARSESVDAYAKARRSYVPELLSNALYHCFRREDESATAVRRAMFDTLRSDASERRRTMDILAGTDLSRRSFGAAFLRIAARAMGQTVAESASVEGLAKLPARLGGFREWMQWPAALVVPSALDEKVRARSSSQHPIPQLAELTPNGERLPLAHEERRAADVSLHEAIERGSEALLRELEEVAARVGSVPDAELAGPALSCMRAILSTRMSAGMTARMTLGRRRLAVDGFSRLLSREPECRHLAELLLVLLGGASWPALPIGDLPEGVRALLDCQTQAGGFARSREIAAAPQAAGELELTALALRALAALDAERPDASDAALPACRERAAAWVESRQAADGGFGDVSRTAWALESLLAAGRHPGTPSVRRASAALAAALADEADPIAQAHALRALVYGGASSTEPVVRCARALAAREGDGWRVTREVVEALAACEQRRAMRPRPKAKARASKPAAAQASPAASEATDRSERRRQRRERQRVVPAELAEDWAFCRESLGEVSRTFSRPIQMLTPKLEVAVSLGYLLCRIADTIEDHVAVDALTAGDERQRDALFRMFLDALEGHGDPAELATAFVAAEGDDAELTLVRAFPRVMRVYASQDDHVRAVCRRWVGEMARGMNLYRHREAGADGVIAIHTIPDLERYCFYVAGTVGHLLTDLFAHDLGEDPHGPLGLRLRDHAEGFATGLQLTNILKDVTDDLARGVSFIPRSECARHGFDVAAMTDPVNRAQAHAAVAPLFDLAKARLDEALEYSLTIPADQSATRLFCLLPLWMAARTLVLARGNDAMFEAGQPVKISRAEVEQLIAECVAMAGQDDQLRSRYAKLFAEPASEGRKVS